MSGARLGFFDNDDDEDEPATSGASAAAAAAAGVDEVDELDAFMMGVEQQLQAELARAAPAAHVLMAEEEEDHLESFLAYKEEQDAARPEKDVEVDENGDAIDLNTLELAPLDHSTIVYDAFRKNVFVAVPGQTLAKKEEADAFRKKLDIRVRVDEGLEVPPVAPTIEGLGLSRTFTALLRKDFEKPTPIQAQTVPAALCGHDIIGIAKTGSGKTGAFLWPVIQHLCNLPGPQERGSPYAVVIAPTRELAKQIYDQCREWCKPFNFTVVNLFGGSGTMGQITALREPCEIVVGTPGRVIHFLRKRYLKASRVRFLCLDEADKMLDMGFEQQVRSVCGQLRPDRLTLMFSATFRPNVQKLANDLLLHPIRINVGAIGSVNMDIDQIPVVLADDAQKQQWLLAKLPQFVREGSVLIFVAQKQGADALAAMLNARGFQAAATHGEKGQQERNKIHFAFKNGNLPILVATDVASRGLDIGTVKTVVQFDAAKNLEIHTHRVGRTGRAGEKGSAYALITTPKFAHVVAKSMTQGKQLVPPDVLQLSQRHKSRDRRNDAPEREGGEDDEEEAAGGGGDRQSKKQGRRRDDSSKLASWSAAKKQHNNYSRGAGLGSEPQTKKRREDEDDNRRPGNDSLGAAFSEFTNAFVPAQRK